MSILYSPWTSQPQQTGLSDRYQFAFAYNATNPVEQRSNVMLSRTSGTALQINAQGVAVRGGANSSSDGIPLPATAAARLYNTAATIIAVIRADDWTASQAPIIYAVRDNTTTSVSFFVSSDGISATRRINLAIGGASLTTADNVLPVGRPTVVAASFGPNGMRLFVDGVLVASNGTTSLPADNSITPWLLNRATGARAFNNQLNACYAIFGQPPDADIRNLSQNPWQIFRPLPRRIFVPVSAGGGTTAVTADHNASYTITGSVAADASAAYAIRAAVTADATASYSLRAAAQADQAAAYAIRAAVASDLAGSYAIQTAGTVTTGLDAAYAVRGSVAGDISVGYQIAAAVQAEVAAAYAVRTAVQKDLAAGYAIQAGLSAVSADLIAAYAVDGSTTTRAPSGAGPSIILPGSTRPGSLQTSGRPPNLGGRRH